MTPPGRTGPIVVALAALAVGLGGCTAPGASPLPSPSLGSRAPGTPTAAPSESPAPSVVAASVPSIEPAPTAQPSIEPSPEPPAASIAVEGGDPVVGDLGTYTWDNSGSSSPGLDGTPIHVGAGEPVTFSLATEVGIVGWQVSRVLPSNHDRVGAVSMGEGTIPPIRFRAPPAGTWSVEVSVLFARNLGSAAYFWRMEVD